MSWRFLAAGGFEGFTPKLENLEPVGVARSGGFVASRICSLGDLAERPQAEIAEPGILKPGNFGGWGFWSLGVVGAWGLFGGIPAGGPFGDSQAPEFPKVYLG